MYVSTMIFSLLFFTELQSRQIVHWEVASGGWVPHGKAVAGGHDVNGEKIYVGRAHCGGDVIPGKIVPSHHTCYVPFAQKENPVRDYQVLCTTHDAELQWLPASGGQVPTGAIEGGRTNSGEKLFIGRTHHQGSHVVGKVHPSHKVIYIPFGGNEVSKPDYEVLCVKSVAF